MTPDHVVHMSLLVPIGYLLHWAIWVRAQNLLMTSLGNLIGQSLHHSWQMWWWFWLYLGYEIGCGKHLDSFLMLYVDTCIHVCLLDNNFFLSFATDWIGHPGTEYGAGQHGSPVSTHTASPSSLENWCATYRLASTCSPVLFIKCSGHEGRDGSLTTVEWSWPLPTG